MHKPGSPQETDGTILPRHATAPWLWLWQLLLALAMAIPSTSILAQTPDVAFALASGDTSARLEALSEAVATPVPGLEQFLIDLRDGRVWLSGDRVYRVDAQGRAIEIGADTAIDLPDGAARVVNNNRMRRAIDAALASMHLFSDDIATRRSAVQAFGSRIDPTLLPLIERALDTEQDAVLQDRLKLLMASAQLSATGRAQRLAAAERLGRSDQPSVRALLSSRINEEQDPQVLEALQSSHDEIVRRLAWGERLGLLFTGISLGSILVLVALGLAITFGLLGVINMAHGELMMIGAYATWCVQGLFRSMWPALFDAYILAAIPVSFLAAAAVGVLIERGVIRWLYGRPLETLLATWGISLILMQTVRSLFGAQNVQVQNPNWLSGGMQVMSNLVLPWNRIAIIVFTAAVVAGVAWLIARTRLGLFVRAVTQNRNMAACTGVNTARVDTLAFALGSGIAGLAGCALSQIGNVGPELGQGYIVDAFMVVVTGGVGQLAGTVSAGLGIGIVNKFLEGWMGAVLAKIAILMLVIVFIQKRPQGLFALKGRGMGS